jgi:hypothetical protein
MTQERPDGVAVVVRVQRSVWREIATTSLLKAFSNGSPLQVSASDLPNRDLILAGILYADDCRGHGPRGQ